MKKIFFVSLLSALIVLGSTSAAFAQDGGETDPMPTGTYWVITTAGLAISAITPFVITTVILAVAAAQEMSELERYMDENAVALQHDIHTGGGESARDLALLFAVSEENMEDFGGLLHENRRRLAPLAEPGAVDEAAAREFAGIVVAEMQHRGLLDERLARQSQLISTVEGS